MYARACVNDGGCVAAENRDLDLCCDMAVCADGTSTTCTFNWNACFYSSRTHVYTHITPCLFNFTGRRRLTVEDALAIAAAISDDAKPATLTLPSDGSILKVFESKHFLLISSYVRDTLHKSK